MELAAHIESKPAGGGIAAGAGVVIEAVLVGTAVVVDDGRAEMEAVTQGCAADGAGHGVERFDMLAVLLRQALHPGVVVQKMDQSGVDILRLARS